VADQVLTSKPCEALLLGKAWKIKLVNEAADDAGGVFDEVLTHMCAVCRCCLQNYITLLFFTWYFLLVEKQKLKG